MTILHLNSKIKLTKNRINQKSDQSKIVNRLNRKSSKS